MDNVRKLYKGRNKILSGVCSGLAKYLNLDESLTRILYVIATFFTALLPMIILYIIMAMIIPNEPIE